MGYVGNIEVDLIVAISVGLNQKYRIQRSRC